ncbi:MAG: DUF11 domain-containing protein, partial [Chloroflexi bacterium]|nr:DUF11 domain-containing protein [Chloroflexota bacterium]
AAAVTPTFTAPATAAVVTFTLTVNDGNLDSTPDEMVVTVNEQALEADLALSQTIEVEFVTFVTFTLRVENLGPDAADGAVVSDTLAANVTNATWTCMAMGGAACGAASGTGDLLDTLGAFPAGGVVTYTVRGVLTNWGMVTNTAEVTPPVGATDPITSNNRATVTRYQIILPVIFNNATTP